MKIIPVILSGGDGTRLWPLSRKQYPKQYLSLGEKQNIYSLLQATIQRLIGLENLDEPIIICNHKQRFLVKEQLRQIGLEKPIILLEPEGRGTAPAIGAAAIYVKNSGKGDQNLLLVLSADHMIKNIEEFHRTIKTSVNLAMERNLAIFGITPTEPNTGYGYIKKSLLISNNSNSIDAYRIEKFIEKPDLKSATSMLKNDAYLWNSGIFMFRVDVLLQELTNHAAEIIYFVEKAVNKATMNLNFVHLEPSNFTLSPHDSIDYALLEKTDKVVVLPLDAGWNDIGSWSELKKIGEKDENGNVITGDVYSLETINSFIYSESRMIATIGVENLIIVDTPDAILIADESKSQQVKEIVEKLKKNNRKEQFYHRKVFRPWGWYDTIETGEHFQVKKLHVDPGAKLSLQLHYKRAEHWVVIKGIATVTNGEKIITLTEGQSTYIPISVKHSLENLESKPLEIIEVQSGSYLGEDDIIRFEDMYGRK